MSRNEAFRGAGYQEDLAALPTTGYAVCAFFTPGDGFERYADRLAASCRQFGLPYSLWCAPAIHRSVTLRGTTDLAYTKSSFIRFCLDRLAGAGVAYLDVDTMLVSSPVAFDDIRASGADFAVYNWFADPHNEAYLPAGHRLGPVMPGGLPYLFSHRVERCSSDQLNCSGVTQYYAPSPAARALLLRWQEVIADNPRSADDQCLSFAYNNGTGRFPAVKAHWLGKPYARSPWWPHVEPVVLHPDIPAQNQPFVPPGTPEGHQAFYPERCRVNAAEPVFPRDGGVDVASGVVFRIDVTGRPHPVGRYPGRFWLYDRNGQPVPSA